jgi:hypothetical protein
MTQAIQLRRGTAAQWTAANPTLASGEIGIETDTGLFKIGDGTTDWITLGYSASAFTGDLTGTANRITVTGGTGAVVGAGTSLNLPQDIHTSATPQFMGIHLLADTAKAYYGAGNDMTIWYDGTDGNIKTSDVAASDLQITCGANKTIELTNVVYDDLRILPGSFDRPGASDPASILYYPNAGAIGTYLYEFSKNNVVSFACQLPHKYKTGTDIGVHLHWTPGANGATENGHTVGWKVDYSWSNIDGTFGDMQMADLSDACDGTDHKHQMTPEVTIDGHTAAKHISSMLICNLRRSDTGTDDTWAGTAVGALPMILEVDFHFQIDTIGSRQTGIK